MRIYVLVHSPVHLESLPVYIRKIGGGVIFDATVNEYIKSTFKPCTTWRKT
jgi:hypothetical protein